MYSKHFISPKAQTTHTDDHKNPEVFKHVPSAECKHKVQKTLI